MSRTTIKVCSMVGRVLEEERRDNIVGSKTNVRIAKLVISVKTFTVWKIFSPFAWFSKLERLLIFAV